MTMADDLVNYVNTHLPASPVTGILSQIISVTAAFAYLIGIIFAIFIVVRFARRYSMYAGKGTPYGPYSVMWIGGDGYAHGNLSKNEWFGEEHFDSLKKQAPEMNMNFEELEALVNSKKIVICDFKVTDHSKVWSFKDTDDVVIIANGQIDSNDFSVPEKNGRFSFTSATFKETARSVGAFTTSKHFEIIDPYGKKRVVWCIDLIPQNPFTILNDIMTGKPYQVVVQSVGNMEALAKSVVLLPTLIRLEDQNKKLESEVSDYRRLLLKEQDRNKALNALFNKANHLLTEKIFVGYSKPQTPLQRVSEIAFIFAAFIIPLGAYEELPKSFPTINPAIVSFVSFIIILALRELWKKDQQKKDELGVLDPAGVKAAES